IVNPHSAQITRLLSLDSTDKIHFLLHAASKLASPLCWNATAKIVDEAIKLLSQCLMKLSPIDDDSAVNLRRNRPGRKNSGHIVRFANVQQSTTNIFVISLRHIIGENNLKRLGTR